MDCYRLFVEEIGETMMEKRGVKGVLFALYIFFSWLNSHHSPLSSIPEGYDGP
jgi:hypothetical protein